MNSQTNKSLPLGAGLVVASSIIFASYAVWTRLMGDYFGNFTQAVIRSALVVVFLFPIAIWRKQLVSIQWRRDKWMFVGLFISTALISAPLYYAVNIIGVGLAVGIAYAGILLGTFIFGWLIGNEKYTREKQISTILGIIGLWLIFHPSMKTFGALGLLMALMGGLAAGLNMVVNRQSRYSATQTTIHAWVSTIISNLPFIFLFHEVAPNSHLDRHWLYLLIFAVASVASSWLLISGLKLIEAGAAGILGLLEIVFGVIYGITFFDEELEPIVALGMICIIAAASIPYFQHRWSSYKNKSSELH